MLRIEGVENKVWHTILVISFWASSFFCLVFSFNVVTGCGEETEADYSIVYNMDTPTGRLALLKQLYRELNRARRMNDQRDILGIYAQIEAIRQMREEYSLLELDKK